MKTLSGPSLLIKKIPEYSLHVFFFIVFSLVSVLNHYYFRSSALDYGIVNQALFQFANFHPAVCTVLLQNVYAPYLGLHMSLWVPLVSPFYWIFGSYTLLWFQNAALIFCGIGIYKLASKLLKNEAFSLLITLQFYLSFAIYSALAFDFHDNVIGACFVPWFFYFYSFDKKWQAGLCFLAILISKENFAIWLPFIILGMVWVNKQFNYRQWAFPMAMILFSVIWFFAVSKYIMPALSPVGKFEQLSRFSHLGNNVSEIVKTIFTQPLKVFSLFYESHVQPDPEEIIKHELLFSLILSGGIALIWKLEFLWMILPLLMQKLWNKETAFWGINYHYNIEFAPVIGIAIILMLYSIKSDKLKRILLLTCLLGTGYITYSKMQHRVSVYYNEVNENVFIKAHYKSALPVNIILQGLGNIKSNDTVSAQTNLIPHLANRDYIYHFPTIKNANIIAVLYPCESTYPLSQETYIALIDSLKSSPFWEINFQENTLLILKRKE